MSQTQTIQMLPIEQINIINPRIRNRKTFGDISENISLVGLKRPITVTASHAGIPGKTFDLVCGQGRLEAFIANKQSSIPAIVIDADEEKALIMSLVENLARRHHQPKDLLQGIMLLQQQGYQAKDISHKTGLRFDYVQAIINLLANGEERLVYAVETGKLPITVALRIMASPGNEQAALQEAYENNLLRGHKLATVQRLIEARNTRGKGLFRNNRDRSGEKKNVSAKDLVKAYQKEVDRKKLLIRKAEFANNRLLFVTEVLRRLLREDHFSTLLQAEGLSTLPQPLAAIIYEKA